MTMKVAVFVTCMAIIAQLNAAPTESGSTVAHNNNEFDLPPMARGGFKMDTNVSVYTHETISNKLKLILLPDAQKSGDPIPENCINMGNTEGKHICVTANQELIDKSAEPKVISHHQISIIARLNDEENELTLSLLLNGSSNGFTSIRLEDFEKQKHFSVGGIEDIQTLEFKFRSNEEELVALK